MDRLLQFELNAPIPGFAGRLITVLMALTALVLTCRWLLQKRRASASLSWPFAEAKVHRYSIECCEQEEGVTWTLKLRFSYRPSPESDWYIGRYNEDFNSKADAELQLRSLQERQLYTRYNPSKPSEHFMDPYRDIFKDEQFPPQRVLKY